MTNHTVNVSARALHLTAGTPTLDVGVFNIGTAYNVADPRVHPVFGIVIAPINRVNVTPLALHVTAGTPTVGQYISNISKVGGVPVQARLDGKMWAQPGQAHSVTPKALTLSASAPTITWPFSSFTRTASDSNSGSDSNTRTTFLHPWVLTSTATEDPPSLSDTAVTSGVSQGRTVSDGQAVNQDISTIHFEAARINPAVVMLEATGFGPDLEDVPTEMVVLAQDVPSASLLPIRPNSDGRPNYSAERWLRIQDTGASVAISNLRFWIDNLAPNDGWNLYYGIAATYRRPLVGQRSDIATLAVPTVDSGSLNPNVIDVIDTYSPWIVLQAVGTEAASSFQDTELNIRFAWDEV